MSTRSSAGTTRYSRQVSFAPLGDAGQQQLERGRALICGCGALGSVIANTLVRGGVGFVRIVDRDFLELNNLQRQVLYDEADVAAGLPKAIAAAGKLRAINSQVDIEPVVADVTFANIEQLASDVDVIVDGTDNFEIRMLLNEFSVKQSVPWVYGGVIGGEGQTMTILPGETACFTCLMPELPAPGSTPTCDTAGVLGSVVGVIGSLQAVEALKILSGNIGTTSGELLVIDVWQNRVRRIALSPLVEAGGCPTCHQGQFPWLEGTRGGESVVLCGRNAVQIAAAGNGKTDLALLADKLAPLGEVTQNVHLLRFAVEEFRLTIFADGRTIVSGTDDPATARTLVARYLGS